MFVGSTDVEMKDGSFKPIKLIELGDLTFGGRVYEVSKRSTNIVFKYNNAVFCDGMQAVLHDGHWDRVFRHDVLGYPVHLPHEIELYGFACDDHQIKVGDTIFADAHETDVHKFVNDEESLGILNGEYEIESLSIKEGIADG